MAFPWITHRSVGSASAREINVHLLQLQIILPKTPASANDSTSHQFYAPGTSRIGKLHEWIRQIKVLEHMYFMRCVNHRGLSNCWSVFGFIVKDSINVSLLQYWQLAMVKVRLEWQAFSRTLRIIETLKMFVQDEEEITKVKLSPMIEWTAKLSNLDLMHSDAGITFATLRYEYVRRCRFVCKLYRNLSRALPKSEWSKTLKGWYGGIQYVFIARCRCIAMNELDVA